jgi:hypothetical protein
MVEELDDGDESAEEGEEAEAGDENVEKTQPQTRAPKTAAGNKKAAYTGGLVLEPKKGLIN